MPALVIAIPALLALLLALGQLMTKQMLSGWLGGIWVIGPALAKTVSFDFGIFSWLWGQVDGVLQVWTQMVGGFATELGLNVQTHVATHRAIQGIQNVTVPVAVQAGVQPISAALSELEGGVSGFIGLSNTNVAVTNAHLGVLDTKVDQVLPAEIEALRGQVSSDFTTITGQIATGQAQTERDIATAARGAQAGAVAQVEPQIGAIQTEVGGIAHTVTQVLAPGLAGLLTLVPTLVGRIATTEECTAGICEAGGPGQAGNTLGELSTLLNGVAELITGGALFAFIAAVVADPEGAATEVIDTVGTLVEDTAHAVVTLVGAV